MKAEEVDNRRMVALAGEGKDDMVLGRAKIDEGLAEESSDSRPASSGDIGSFLPPGSVDGDRDEV